MIAVGVLAWLHNGYLMIYYYLPRDLAGNKYIPGELKKHVSFALQNVFSCLEEFNKLCACLRSYLSMCVRHFLEY